MHIHNKIKETDTLLVNRLGMIIIPKSGFNVATSKNINTPFDAIKSILQTPSINVLGMSVENPGIQLILYVQS